MRIVLLTALGVGGASVIGALLGFAFKKISHHFSDLVLAFAAGVMLCAAVLGLIVPSCQEKQVLHQRAHALRLLPDGVDGLLSRLRAAQARIAEEGIVLEDTEADRDLVIMYAGWLWRQRVTGEGMPRMLRYALNNRLFSRKAAGEV